MSVIRCFARGVAERFQPEKIILFGSHAYGKPHADSDVDILVIMPCRNELDQAVKINLAIDPPFPLDIVVRTPHNLSWRLEEGTGFLGKSCRRAKCCMKRLTAEWVRKAETDFLAAAALADASPPLHDAVCFHCQQCAEKYLKALLQESAAPVPRTQVSD